MGILILACHVLGRWQVISPILPGDGLVPPSWGLPGHWPLAFYQPHERQLSTIPKWTCA